MKKILTLLFAFFAITTYSQNVGSSPQVTIPKADAAGKAPMSDATGNYFVAPWDSLVNLYTAKYGSTVLFVSKEAGVDSTAERGNPGKPWQNLWTARDSANAGDLIWVMAGSRFTMTDTVDGGDRLLVTGDQEWTSLMKDSVTYYFDANTSIKNSITLSAYPMFFDTSGYTTRVLGHGTFHTVRSNTTATVFNNANTNFFFQADSVISNSANTGWGRGFCSSEFSTIHLDVKVWDVTNSREFHLYYPTSGDTCVNCQYTVDIQYLNAKECDQVFALPRAFWTDSNVSFNIDQLEATVNYYSPMQISGKRNAVAINVNTGNLRSGTTTNTYFLGHPSDTWTDSLNTSSFNCNSCNTEVAIAFIDNNDLNAFKQGTTLRFTGNYTHSGDSTGINALFFLRSVTDTNFVTVFDGSFVSHNVPIFRTGGVNRGKFFISGNYRVLDENVPVLDIDHELTGVTLLNSYFDNIGTTTPPIRASVATTIKALNAGYQVGGILDGDVTIVNLPTY